SGRCLGRTDDAESWVPLERRSDRCSTKERRNRFSASSRRGDLKKSMTNIVSECRSANIIRDHAMILPDDATPKPDGIFGKDRAKLGRRRQRSKISGGAVRRRRQEIKQLVARLPPVAGDATPPPVIGHCRGRPRWKLSRIGRERRAVVAPVGPIDRRRSHGWC